MKRLLFVPVLGLLVLLLVITLPYFVTSNNKYVTYAQTPTTITVCPVPGPGCNYIGGDGIQQAIDAAPFGTEKTTILIKSGKYSRQIATDMPSPYGSSTPQKCLAYNRGKNLIIQGEQNTIFDGAGSAAMIGFCVKDGIMDIKSVKIYNFKKSDSIIHGDGLMLTGTATVKVENSVFAGNYWRGIAVNNDVIVNVSNVSFFDNMIGMIGVDNSRINIINAIFAHNRRHDGLSYPEGILSSENNIVNVSYSLFYNNTHGNFYSYEGGQINREAGIIENLDPKFIHFVVDDLENNDYHLASDSPAINAGDPTILDPDSSRSDIGAYGGPGACGLDSGLPGCAGGATPTPTPTPILKPADLNHDGVVGEGDVAILWSNYNPLVVQPGNIADINKPTADGYVNSLDYSELVKNWGR